ncbi:MAG: ABC transporter substrate-binding protein [Geminicoccaceae bacterium]
MGAIHRRRGALWRLAAILAAPLLATVVRAPRAGAALPPEQFVQTFAALILDVISDRSQPPAERMHQVEMMVSDRFDLERIARIALGRYWKTAPATERQEFSTLFKAYVLSSYGRRFDEFADRRLRVVGSTPAEDDTMVESYVEGGSTPIRLDWRLTPTADGWRILDLMVEGVSLLLTYRNEFAALIERSGGQLHGLIAELRSRVADRQAATG